MKKILLLSIVLIVCNNLFAFTTQGDWRWRKDDGSETTATWLADENVAPEITSFDETLRLRIGLFNEEGGLLDGAILEFSTDQATWDTVNLTATTEAFVLAGSSPNVTDLEPTTQQLSGEGLTFDPGKVIVSSEALPPHTVGSGDETEYEYVIKPTANMQPSTTYYFRVNAAEYPADRPLPSLTTAAVLPIRISDFTVKPDGKSVKVEWTTASEQNNDRFEIERSSDGRAWKVIATVKGSGTTSQARHYQAYDNLPLKGMNYYRIKQYDLNGKSFISDVRSIRMLIENNGLLSVYPNPARSVINFSLRDFSGSNVVATLTNNSGKIIHQETIRNFQANAKYTLNIKQQPAPGIYILQIKGEGLAEAIKVVVQ